MSAAAKKAAAAASRPAISLGEAIMIHNAIHDKARTSVIIQGQRCPISLTTKGNLRTTYIYGVQVMEQNPEKRDSDHARKAALGHKITWFMTKPRWGCIEDGKLTQKTWIIDPNRPDADDSNEATYADVKFPIPPHDEEDDSLPPAKRRKIDEGDDDSADPYSPRHETAADDDEDMFPEPPDASKKFKNEPTDSSSASSNAFPEPMNTGLVKKEQLEDADPEEIDDGRAICQYDAKCYRNNPDHFKKFRHPELKKLKGSLPFEHNSGTLPKPAPKKSASVSSAASNSALAPTAPVSSAAPAAKKSGSSNPKIEQPASAPNRIVDDEDDFPTPPSRPPSAPVKQEPPSAAPAPEPPKQSGSSPSILSASAASQSIQSWEIDYNSIEMGPKLGSGAFGEVRLGVWMGTDVAVKILHANDEKSRDVFYKEANLLCQLRHPNVVPFLGASLQGQLAIVMELMPSSLTKLIKNGPIEIKLLCRVASGIARGIMFLHKSNPPIIHRDLKPDNILLDHANVPKLADFGVSREKIATQEMTRIGTPSYCAPEILKGEKYSEKVDIFSFGMILYAMVSGRAPFRGGENEPALSPLQIMMKIAVQKERPKIPPEVNCPAWLVDLINECWAPKSDQRPSADEILKRITQNAPK